MEAFLENDRRYRNNQMFWIAGMGLVNLTFLYGSIAVLAIGHGILGANPKSYPDHLSGWLETADMLWVIGLPATTLTIWWVVKALRGSDEHLNVRLAVLASSLWLLTALVALALTYSYHETIDVIVILALYVPIIGLVVEWWMHNYRY